MTFSRRISAGKRAGSSEAYHSASVSRARSEAPALGTAGRGFPEIGLGPGDGNRGQTSPVERRMAYDCTCGRRSHARARRVTVALRALPHPACGTDDGRRLSGRRDGLNTESRADSLGDRCLEKHRQVRSEQQVDELVGPQHVFERGDDGDSRGGRVGAIELAGSHLVDSEQAGFEHHLCDPGPVGALSRPASPRGSLSAALDQKDLGRPCPAPGRTASGESAPRAPT